MSTNSRNEIEDPNLAGLPPEAFDEIDPDRGATPEQLEARIRIKREAAMQDSGQMQSPHHAEDIEPITPPEETATEEAQTAEDEEPADEEEDDGAAEDQAAADQPEEEEEGGEEDEEASEEDGDFYVGRYRTKEDAEKGLAEKDRLIAEHFRLLHEQQAQQQQQTGVEPQIDTERWHEWAEETVESGAGVQGAMAALEKGGRQGYDIYIAHWISDEDPSSRAEAIAFNNEVQRQFAAREALRAVQPQQQQSQEPAAEAEAARSIVAQKFPDFNDLEDDMNNLITNPDSPLDDGTRQWLYELSTQGVTGKARAWEYLYRTAAATRAPKREQARAVERKRRKTSSDQAKIDATVSSTEGTSVRTPLSEAERAVADRRNRIREKAGLPLLDTE